MTPSGYDLDPAYVELARARLETEAGRRRQAHPGRDGCREPARRSSGDGASAAALARSALECGRLHRRPGRTAGSGARA